MAFNPGVAIDLPGVFTWDEEVLVETDLYDDAGVVNGHMKLTKSSNSYGIIYQFENDGDADKYYATIDNKMFAGETTTFSAAEDRVRVMYAERDFWDLVKTDSYMAKEFIPISWASDGSVAPDAETEFSVGNGKIKVRDFGGGAGATVQDVVFVWEVPETIKVSDGIKYKACCVVTQDDATGTAKQCVFRLSGYSVGDEDSISGTFGTEIRSETPDVNLVQNDRILSYKSAEVTITNLAQGETAFLHFERDTADGDDDYLKAIGVYGIILYYTTD